MALSYREKMFFFEALFFQLSIGLLLKIIPFRWIPRLFSNPSGLSSQISTFSAHRSPLSTHRSLLRSHTSHLTSEASYLEAIKAATIYASRLSPWKNKCLVQSLAARLMLKERKIQSNLSLGMSFDQNKTLIAHAWLKAGDFEVVEQNGVYHELYLF